jgi:hypothetical protein
MTEPEPPTYELDQMIGKASFYDHLMTIISDLNEFRMWMKINSLLYGQTYWVHGSSGYDIYITCWLNGNGNYYVGMDYYNNKQLHVASFANSEKLNIAYEMAIIELTGSVVRIQSGVQIEK